MNCPKCGMSIENNAKFCEFCGTAVEKGGSTQAVVPNKQEAEDVCRKNPGIMLKKMWIISVIAIALVIITFFVAMVPLSREAKSISVERREHISYENRNSYYGHDSENCSKCRSYKREEENNNRDGAMLWQKTITDCSLIALAGAMVYGVGFIAEKSVDSKKEQI